MLDNTRQLPESIKKQVEDFANQIGIDEKNKCLFMDGAQYIYNLLNIYDKTPKHNVMVDGFPRRCRLDLSEPAETAISIAIQEVEKMDAHPMLTHAVILLGDARDKVSDFVDFKFNEKVEEAAAKIIWE